MLRRTLLVSVFMIVPAVAYADVRYQMESRDISRGDTTQNEILVKDGMLRMGVSSNGKNDMTNVIFNPGDEEIIMIDDSRKEVRRMTKADMDRMQGMMAGMSQKMQDALKSMPPAARKQAEEMMKKQGLGGMGNMGQPPARNTSRPLGSSDTVAGISCDMYEMSVDGKKTQEFCAADADDIEGGAELMKAVGGLAKFMEGFTQAMGGQRMGDFIEPVDGKFPVMSRQFENGKVVSESRLVSAEKVSLSADQFMPPKGYKERKLMER